MRRALTLLAPLVFVLFAAPLAASPMSDFQARLAQTHWNLQALEGMVKAQKSSPRTVAAPEAVESFLQLLAENVAALNQFASAKVTDEQGRVIREGIQATAGQLRDLSSLIAHRGFSNAAGETSRLEMSCRLAIEERIE